MRSQIEESIEELARKINVATHSKQSVIKGYKSHFLFELNANLFQTFQTPDNLDYFHY
jgi:hypothetical protein